MKKYNRSSLLACLTLLLVSSPFRTVYAASTIFASVLPASRAVAVNGTATAFATLINAGASDATGCAIQLPAAIPATFTYQTTDPATNALTGTPNTPVPIAMGAAQSFVFGITPTATFPQTDIPLQFSCTSGESVTPISGVNTFLLTASAQPTPDIVALAATVSNDGVVRTGGINSAGAFAVSTVNVGAAGPVIASVDSGVATVPATFALCQTNAQAACLQPPSATVSTSFNPNETGTFSIFVTAGTTVIPLDPATTRAFVRFKSAGGDSYGATSVAVTTDSILKVTGISPKSGGTGTKIIVDGSGFSKDSRVYIADQEILGTRYLSTSEIEVLIPPMVDSGNTLKPLSAGSYKIRVDSSAPVDFTVTDLPPNPGTPGQTLQDKLGPIIQALPALHEQLVNLLPGLLEDTQGQANNQAILNALFNLSKFFNENSDLLQDSISNLDASTLDLLDRILTEPEASQVQAMTNVLVPTAVDDQWLMDRQQALQNNYVRQIDILNKAFSVCSLARAFPATYAAAPGLIAFCLIIHGTITTIESVIELDIRQKYGHIEGIRLRRSGDELFNHATLRFNNVDNNDIHPTSRAENIIGAELATSKGVDFLSLTKLVFSSLIARLDQLEALWGPVSDAIALKEKIDTLITNCKELFNITGTESINTPLNPREISTKYLEWINSNPLIYRGCDFFELPDPIITFKADGIISMPDKTPGFTGFNGKDFPLGFCKYKINSGYRLPSEGSIFAGFDYTVKKYGSVSIHAGTDLHVESNQANYLGFSFSCDSNANCQDYFDEDTVTLRAAPVNGQTGAVLWSGLGTAACSLGQEFCIVKIDRSNVRPPEVFVSLQDGWVGIQPVSPVPVIWTRRECIDTCTDSDPVSTEEVPYIPYVLFTNDGGVVNSSYDCMPLYASDPNWITTACTITTGQSIYDYKMQAHLNYIDGNTVADRTEYFVGREAYFRKFVSTQPLNNGKTRITTDTYEYKLDNQTEWNYYSL